jgi:adapter protein MecA 1/2
MPDLETYAPPADDENISIYGFETLDTASRAMRAVSNAFCSYSDSKLYRCDDKYYIFVRPDDITNMERDAFDSIINQFGEKHRSNTIARAYIAEHGEIMIKNNAVNLLATL